MAHEEFSTINSQLSTREAEHAESRADFAHKMNIALKEANETLYWLELLHQAEYVTDQSFASIRLNSEELVKLLVSIVKTTKGVSRAQ